MKKLIVLNNHSFIDVITNSSTELFTCDTDKSVDMVKEILQKIIEGYNAMSDNSYDMDIFGEIYLFKYSEFRKWKDADKLKRAECEKSGNWEGYQRDYDNDFYTIDSWFTDKDDESTLNSQRKRIIEDGPLKGDGFWSSDNYNPYRHRLDIVQGETYDYKKKNEEVNKIFQELSDSDTKPEWWSEPWKYQPYSKTIVETLDGKIIIKGSDDNSIPYDIWNHINNQLNCVNYHLG